MTVNKQELLDMILKLQERLDLLEGRPRGEVTMRDYRLACERGDKATMARYLAQFKRPAAAQPPKTETMEARL